MRHFVRRTCGPASLALALWIPAAVAADDYVRFPAPELEAGRTVWLENCEGCHGYGIAGAPVPMVWEEWQQRLDQPVETLYAHALDGFFGPDDTMMPARGGNPDLSDEEVRQAVDYMASLARHHHKQGDEK